MTTAREIITRAMQRGGILTKTEQPDADEANDALDTLNNMLSSWSNEGLLIYSRTLENFTLTSGVASYTMGTGGVFNTTRPLFIAEAYVRDGDTDLDVSVIDDGAYSNIADKDALGVPYWLNCNNGFPLATIRLWPVPSSSYVLYLLSEKELTQFTLDDTVSLPPGWKKALIDNLAVELQPEYGQQVDPFVLKKANEAKGNIKLAILKNRTMDSFPAGNGLYNIYTGYRR